MKALILVLLSALPCRAAELCGLALEGSPVPPSARSESFAKIAGTVEDGEGRLADAEVFVSVRSKGGVVSAAARAEGGRFELRLPAGMIETVFACAPGLALSSVEPPLHEKGLSQETWLQAAETHPLTIRLGKSGSMAAKVEGLAGRPLRLRLERIDGSAQVVAQIEGDDALNARLAAGPWEVIGIVSPGTPSAYRPWLSRAVEIPAGGETKLDLTVPPAGSVGVARGGVDLEPLKAKSTRLYPNLVRRLAAVESGTGHPVGVQRFFAEDLLPWSLDQGSDGRWRPSDRDGIAIDASTFAVPAGRFDLEVLDFFRAGPPYAVVRAQSSVEVKEGAVSELALRPEDYLPAGTAELRGVLQWTNKVPVRDAFRLDRALVPCLELRWLREHGGRRAAVACALVPDREMTEYLAAERRGDSAAAARLGGKPREYRVAGLAAGRYLASVWVDGYEPRKVMIELQDGEITRLDVDMNR